MGSSSLLLLPPTSGLARRWRWRGAQLDRLFALYASRSRLLAWPQGPEAAAEGEFFSTPWRGLQLDGEFFSLPSSLLTRSRSATASRLLLNICSFGFVSLSVSSQNVSRLDYFLLPSCLWLAGRADGARCWKEGPVLLVLSSPLTAARVEAWLEGLDQLGNSRMLCSVVVLDVILPIVPDLAESTKITKGME